MNTAREDDPLQALARLVRDQRAALTGLARREGLSAEDALDCVHDAFCTFLQRAARGDLPPAEEQTALLAGIVVNTSRNRRRRHYLARQHGPIEAAEGRNDAPSTETLVAHAEECVRLRGCVNKLCKTERSVMMMRLLEERPGEDVAAALGITRGYADVILHRAKASLLVCMMEGEEMEGEE